MESDENRKATKKVTLASSQQQLLTEPDRSWLPSELSIRCWKYEIYVKNLVINQWIACVVGNGAKCALSEVRTEFESPAQGGTQSP